MTLSFGTRPGGRRRLIKVVLFNVVACAILLAVAADWVWVRMHSFGGAWHAELLMKNMNCSTAEVCRLEPHTPEEFPLATGQPTPSFLTNALGYRGRDVPVEEHDPKLVRLQIYGDSMILAAAAPEGEDLCGQLERILGERFPNRRFEVQNFGMPLNYTVSGLRIYQAFGRVYRPDVVVFEFNINPHDVNERVFQIRGSSLLQHLVESRVGAEIVNAWQISRMSDYTFESAGASLRTQMQPLVDDERTRGLHVAFWGFWSYMLDALPYAVPPELQHVDVTSGLSMKDYVRSPYVIPGDGHPTVAGHRFFATRLADALGPTIAALPPRQ